MSRTRSELFFKPYQLKILRVLWMSPEPLCAREIYEILNKSKTQVVSRPKIIHFLDTGVDDGILDFTADTDNSIKYCLNGFKRMPLK